jgi:hypothetical protein
MSVIMGLKSYIMKPTKECKQIFVAVAVLMIVWFISQAQALTVNSNENARSNSVENYSAIGTVSLISTSTGMIDISDGAASDGNTGSDFTFNLAAANNIESVDYTQLSLGDLSLGDKVVVQGLEDNGLVTIKRIIDFTWNGFSATSSIATSTDSVSTSTDSISTTTDSDDNASSTDNATSLIDNIASSTNDVASTTSTDSIATSTDSVSTSTDSISTTTDFDDNASSTDNIASTTNIIASTTDNVSLPPVDTNASTTDQ